MNSPVRRRSLVAPLVPALGALCLVACGRHSSPVAPTRDTTPPATVADLRVTAATDSSLTLGWTAPGDDGTSGQAATYVVRLSTHAPLNPSSWWDSAATVPGPPPPQPAGRSETFPVKGLAASTTYYFALHSADSDSNRSGISNIASGQTRALGARDSIPPAAVQDLAVAQVSGPRVLLTWTAPGDDGTTGTAALYDLRYSLAPISFTNWSFATPLSGVAAPRPAGSRDSAWVTSLQPGTTYYFGLRAYDLAQNLSAVSNIVQALTSCAGASGRLVRPDGTGDFATIQDAMDSACSGDTILLADGKFTGARNRNIDFEGKNVVVRSRSGNPGACVMDCQSQGRGFYLHTHEGATARIQDLTIANGFGAGSTPSGGSGGGLACVSASPTIVHCVFTGSRSAILGAGAYFDSSSSRVSGCTFSTGSSGAVGSAGGGGAIAASGSRLALESCTFSDNRSDAGSDGGALFLLSSSLDARSCTFQRNAASGGAGMGGAAFLFGGVAPTSTWHFSNCVFTDNFSGFDGGACNLADGVATFDTCTFSRNNCGGSGAALSDVSGSVVLTGCIVEDNTAQGNGGGMLIGAGLGVTLTASRFSGNVANGSGGALVGEPGTLTATRCTWTGNRAGSTGGAIACGGSGPITIADCDLGSNQAASQGGGAYFFNASPRFERCNFTANTANVGGGMYSAAAETQATPTLVSCVFRGNHAVGAASFGGGLDCHNSSVTANQCQFVANAAEERGGGIALYLSYSAFTDCTVSRDTAGVDGGGLYTYFGSYPKYTRCNIVDNVATTGSGGGVFQNSLFHNPTVCQFSECTLARNAAAVDGGGVTSANLDVHLTGCLFDQNTAGGNGGGMIFDLPTFANEMPLDHCQFYDNSAGGQGGGIYYGGPAAVSDFQMCSVAGNRAQTGGGIYWAATGGTLTLLQCTLSSNRAESDQGGGLYIHSSLVNTMQLEKTIIAFSSRGSALAHDEIFNIHISCTDLFGNAGGDWIGDIAPYLGQNGNFSADPLFCDVALKALGLQPGSPCVQDSLLCGTIGAWPAGCATPTRPALRQPPSARSLPWRGTRRGR